MALVDSARAIGATGDLVRNQLSLRTSASQVGVGRPETSAVAGGTRLNMFLYQIDFDGNLRNQALDEGQNPPLWVVLRYLLTAFDESGDSDSIEAHNLIGEGLLALQELNFIRPDSSALALADNPEPLRITFDSGDVELLSKIMQGGDEAYRMSAAFQIRPVMIAPTEPPSYAPAVKTVGPPSNQGVVVIPSLGPRLDALSPTHFEAGGQVILHGQDLAGPNQEVCFGDVCLPADEARSDRVTITLPPPPATAPSPGSYPISVVRVLPSGRRFASNALIGHLLPTLTGATPGALTADGDNRFGDLNLTGVRLGGPEDSIFVAFYRDGAVSLVLEVTGTAAQSSLTVTVTHDDAIPFGPYRVILRVNGVQAPESPEVLWQ